MRSASKDWLRFYWGGETIVHKHLARTRIETSIDRFHHDAFLRSQEFHPAFTVYHPSRIHRSVDHHFRTTTELISEALLASQEASRSGIRAFLCGSHRHPPAQHLAIRLRPDFQGAGKPVEPKPRLAQDGIQKPWVGYYRPPLRSSRYAGSVRSAVHSIAPCVNDQPQLCVQCTRQIFFHPLSRYPGPRIAALTDWYIMYFVWRGDLHIKIREWHEIYGKAAFSASSNQPSSRQDRANTFFPQARPSAQAPTPYRTTPRRPTSRSTPCARGRSSPTGTSR